MSKAQMSFISPRIAALFFLVVTLGLGLRYDLGVIPEASPELVVRGGGSKRAKRQPASVQIGEREALKWSESDRVEAMDWDCLSRKTAKPLQNVTQLRLNGNCLKDIKQITNKNNGYTASIFQAEENFTTDFVSLETGVNNLKFEWMNGASSNYSSDLEIVVEKQ